MSATTSSSAITVLRNRTVMVSLIGCFTILVIWLFAFFIPQGSTLAKYTSQNQQLTAEQSQLEARVALLRATSKATPQLLQLESKYTKLIPPTADFYHYVTLITDTATANGVDLQSITPGTTGAPIAGTNLAGIPITLTTKATYDQTLSFIKAINNLSRLTVINGITLTGGGQKSSRSTVLQETINITIFTTGAAAPTTTN
jgi:Tfp pilus assembly protein PilO